MLRRGEVGLRRTLTTRLFEAQRSAINHLFELLRNRALPFDEFKTTLAKYNVAWNVGNWLDPYANREMVEILANCFDAPYLEFVISLKIKLGTKDRKHNPLYFAVFNPDPSIKRVFTNTDALDAFNDGTTLAHVYAAFDDLEQFKKCSDLMFKVDRRKLTCSYYAGLACSKNVTQYIFSLPEFAQNKSSAMHKGFTSGLLTAIDAIRIDVSIAGDETKTINTLQNMIALFHQVYTSDADYSISEFILIIKMHVYLVVALCKMHRHAETPPYLAALSHLFNQLFTKEFHNEYYITLKTLAATTLSQIYFEQARINQGIETLETLIAEYNELKSTDRFIGDRHLMGSLHILSEKMLVAKFARKYGFHFTRSTENSDSLFVAILLFSHHFSDDYKNITVSELRLEASQFIRVRSQQFIGMMTQTEFYQYCASVAHDAYGDASIIEAISQILKIKICVLNPNGTFSSSIATGLKMLVTLAYIPSIRAYLPLLRDKRIVVQTELSALLEDVADVTDKSDPSKDAFALADDESCSSSACSSTSSTSYQRPTPN